MRINNSCLMTADFNQEVSLEQVEKQLNAMERYMQKLPDQLFSLGVRVVLALVMFTIGSRLISFLRKLIRKTLEKSSVSKEAEQFLDSALKAFAYVILLFMILQLFGIKAASIATVIGSVGVTVGLAIQGSLSNCIGGILILVLKPFKVGDYIIEDSHKNEGTVQEISIFYTKLATVDNRVILIPNGNLANTSLTNVTDEPIRRLDLRVGISYEADIRQAKQVLNQLIEECPYQLKEQPCTVYVDELAESSVVLGLRFWTRKEDYWQARWDMLEAIKYGFDQAGVAIPYPQMDVHLKSED